MHNKSYCSVIAGMLLFLMVCIPAFSEDAVKVLRTLKFAYPSRITQLQFQNDDWSFLVNGETFYWSNGRLLPDAERGQVDKYAPYQFRPYPDKLLPIRVLSPEERQKLRNTVERQESRMHYRNPAFLDTLWGMSNQQEAVRTVQQIVFLGKKTSVHPDIIAPLKLIAEEIRVLAAKKPLLAKWLKTLSHVDAFSWREIAGSATRSMHSYGIALDLVPVSYQGRQVYWRWSREYNPEWWTIPYEQRYFPPDEVIQIFEKHGFIWGGKWFFFDQIHFEYRPELVKKKF